MKKETRYININKPPIVLAVASSAPVPKSDPVVFVDVMAETKYIRGTKALAAKNQCQGIAIFPSLKIKIM